MRVHRFYTGREIELKHDFWLHDQRLIHQWRSVLRMRSGQQLVLFDGIEVERLYELVELKDTEAHLRLVTDYERSLPRLDVYLLWAMLKRDKNEWVLQKATELGVSHFLPIISERCERVVFPKDRAEKIVIEAAEQCGRSDIPTVREPMRLTTALDELRENVHLVVCEQNPAAEEKPLPPDERPIGALVGPEGGWSDAEKQLFVDRKLDHFVLSGFTLRAETAAVTAAAHILKA